MLLNHLLTEYDRYAGNILRNKTRRRMCDYGSGGCLVYIYMVYIVCTTTRIIILTIGKIITTSVFTGNDVRCLVLITVMVTIASTSISVIVYINTTRITQIILIVLFGIYIMLLMYTQCINMIITKVNM